MKIIIDWEVSDGYAGGARPQQTIIDTDDIMEKEEWDELTEDEKQGYILEEVQADFDTVVDFVIIDQREG